MKPPVDRLSDVLASIDWKENADSFIGNVDEATTVANVNLRIAVWARQLETSDKSNPALCFVREMQMAGQHAAALIALSMYKPAAASMRSMVETALYYTYFRTHDAELATLARGKGYYIDKREIVDFHKQHTNDFGTLQAAVGLLAKLEDLYGTLSSIVHGQLPGKWITYTSIRNVKHNAALLPEVVQTFVQSGDVVHALFLCTVGRTFWSAFTTPAKRMLLAGLSGQVKSTLGLDAG